MFVPNNSNEQQLSMFDSERYLSEREKRYLNQSWAKYFAEYIFPKIDETPCHGPRKVRIMCPIEIPESRVILAYKRVGRLLKSAHRMR